MPSSQQRQLSLLARLERETQPGPALSVAQQQELVRMLADLLLQAARPTNANHEEGDDE